MPTVTLHRPALEELSFRQSLLSDPDTMAYNHAWGGTIDFPQERWEDWYGRWLEDNSGTRFYRYLYDPQLGAFVGEIAYHLDEELGGYICDVIVSAKHCGKGYGAQGLALLCQAAKANGVPRLLDNIAVDNPSVSLFLKAGFREIDRNETYILVAKDLT